MKKMNKFFRENARVLLIVFMSLLLVVFLLGDVIQSFSRGNSGPNLKVGDVFGRAVYRNDLAPYEHRIALLHSIGLQVPQLGADPALTYFLLTEEARQMGIHVAREQVLRLLGDNGFSPEMIDRPRREYKMSLDGVYDAIGELLSVGMMASVQAVGIGDSEPRLRVAYRDQAQEASIRVCVLDAACMAKSMVEPSEDAILTHFNDAKDRADAHTDEQLLFGYRIPDRVQVEYLTIDPEAIKGEIRVRDSEVREFFDKNASRYMKDGPIPASSPSNPSPRPERIPMTFEEARERVKEDCRSARAIEKAQQLVNEMRNEARRAWAGQPRAAGGFTEPPPADKLVSFTELRDRYSRQVPVKYGNTGLVDSAGFSAAVAADGLAASFVMAGTQKVRAGELAFRVNGLYKPIEKDPLPILNLFEPSDVLVQQRMGANRQPTPYRAYVIRVIAAAPAGPPASVDDVRDKIVQNLKVLSAFNEAEVRARSIAEHTHEVGFDFAVAQEPGLLDLYTGVTTQPSAPAATQPTADIEHAIKLLGPFTPQGRCGRNPGGMQDVPRSAKLHRELFALADAPFSTTAPVHRMVVAPAAKERKWIIAELVEVKPLYEGDYAQAREQRLQQSGSQVQQRFTSTWYNVDNVMKRTGFVSAQHPVE